MLKSVEQMIVNTNPEDMGSTAQNSHNRFEVEAEMSLAERFSSSLTVNLCRMRLTIRRWNERVLKDVFVFVFDHSDPDTTRS